MNCTSRSGGSPRETRANRGSPPAEATSLRFTARALRPSSARRDGVPQEVRAFHQHVTGGQPHAYPRRFQHRHVVPDTFHHPGPWGGKRRADPFDEAELSQLVDLHFTLTASSRIQDAAHLPGSLFDVLRRDQGGDHRDARPPRPRSSTPRSGIQASDADNGDSTACTKGASPLCPWRAGRRFCRGGEIRDLHRCSRPPPPRPPRFLGVDRGDSEDPGGVRGSSARGPRACHPARRERRRRPPQGPRPPCR